MNIKAIAECLKGKALGTEKLYDSRKGCRCAVGELLSCCGVPDAVMSTIEERPYDGQSVQGSNAYRRMILAAGGEALKEKFGVTSEDDIEFIFDVNDNADESERADEVIAAIERRVLG